MLHVLAQHDVEMAWSRDQHVVEAFPAQCPDEAFRDRVCTGRPDRGADDADVAPVNTASNAAVNCVPVADQEPEPLGVFAEVHEQVAGLLGDPGAGGVGGDPGDVHAAAVVFDTTRM